MILGEGIGSAGSDGCPTIGDRDETVSTRAVIDWLNGRARAFDADGRAGACRLDDRRRSG